MINTILFWFKNSRGFTIPMSIFSWLVVYVYALFHDGDTIFGFLALIGIVFGQLATNLLDDYLDYKLLLKNGALENELKSKCRYITEGKATLNQVLEVIIFYCTIASIIGLILTYFTGWQVIIFAVLGGFFVLMYSKMSLVGLSEVAVGLTFGPILFGGVYWVMTESLNLEVFILSIAVVMFTLGLLYTNSMLDFDSDAKTNKKSLCRRIGDKNKALIVLLLFFTIGYMTIIAGVLFEYFSTIYLCVLFTLPLATELLISLKMFNNNNKSLPPRQLWHFPMENIKVAEEKGIASFMFRMYQARNLMIYFSTILTIIIIIDQLNY